MDALRSQVSSWNLGSDKQLLTALQHFSAELLTRTKSMQDDLDLLAYQTKTADLKLHNTFNQFLMLANSQFIENRVYDEDDDLARKDAANEQPAAATAAPRDEELVPKFTYALNVGLVALDYYARPIDRSVTSPPPGGDTEAAPKPQPAFEPARIDPYNSRPLPFVIGTPEYIEDNFIGLGKPAQLATGAGDGGLRTVDEESSSDDSGSESGSESSSDSGDESSDHPGGIPQAPPVPNGVIPTAPPLSGAIPAAPPVGGIPAAPPVAPTPRPDKSKPKKRVDDDDDWSDVDRPGEPEEAAAPPASGGGFLADLNARLGRPAPPSAEDTKHNGVSAASESGAESKHDRTARASHDGSSSPSTHRHHRKHKKEKKKHRDSHDSDSKEPIASARSARHRASSTADRERREQEQREAEEAERQRQEELDREKRAAEKGLFGDGGDDDDDIFTAGGLFGQPAKPAAAQSKPAAAPPSTDRKRDAFSGLFSSFGGGGGSLFADLEDGDDQFTGGSLFGAPAAAPAAAKSAAQAQAPVAPPAAKLDLSKQEDDEKDTASAPVGGVFVKPKGKSNFSSLFGDDDDEPASSLFGAPPPKPAAAAAKPVAVPAASTAKSSLFDSEDSLPISVKPAAPVVTKKPVPASLFGADDDDSALFGNSSKPVLPSSAKSEIIPVTPAAAPVPVAAAVSARLNINPSALLPGAQHPSMARPAPTQPQADTTPAPKQAPSLFSEESDLFAPKSVTAASGKVAASAKRNSLLFGDDDDDSASLFSAPKPAAAAPAKASASSKASLFDEDDPFGLPKPAAAAPKVAAPVAAPTPAVASSAHSVPASAPAASVTDSKVAALKGAIAFDPSSLLPGATAKLTKPTSHQPSEPSPAAEPQSSAAPQASVAAPSGPISVAQSSKPLIATPAPVADTSAKVNAPAVSAVTSQPSARSKLPSSLFDDDDDDSSSLFGAKPKPAAASTAASSASARSLFDDPVVPKPATATAPASSRAKSLFDDDDDNPLFGGEGAKPKVTPAVTSNAASAASANVASAASKTSLFDEPKALATQPALAAATPAPTQPVVPLPIGRKPASLFDEDDSPPAPKPAAVDKQTSASAAAPSPAPVQAPAAVPAPAPAPPVVVASAVPKAASLFDDSPRAPPQAAPTSGNGIVVPPRARSLFDEDEPTVQRSVKSSPDAAALPPSGPVEPAPAPVESVTAKPVESSSSAPQSVSSLAKSIAFNPAAMLPGASRPRVSSQAGLQGEAASPRPSNPASVAPPSSPASLAPSSPATATSAPVDPANSLSSPTVTSTKSGVAGLRDRLSIGGFVPGAPGRGPRPPRQRSSSEDEKVEEPDAGSKPLKHATLERAVPKGRRPRRRPANTPAFSGSDSKEEKEEDDVVAPLPSSIFAASAPIAPGPSVQPFTPSAASLSPATLLQPDPLAAAIPSLSSDSRRRSALFDASGNLSVSNPAVLSVSAARPPSSASANRNRRISLFDDEDVFGGSETEWAASEPSAALAPPGVVATGTNSALTAQLAQSQSGTASLIDSSAASSSLASTSSASSAPAPAPALASPSAATSAAAASSSTVVPSNGSSQSGSAFASAAPAVSVASVTPVPAPAPAPAPAHVKRSSSLFDDDDDIFGGAPRAAQPAKPAAPVAGTSVKRGSSLFDDTDDLLGALKAKPAAKKEAIKDPFGDDFAAPRASAAPAPSPTAVSPAAPAAPAPPPVAAPVASSPAPAAAAVPSASPSTPSASSSAAAPASSRRTKSLFDDDDTLGLMPSSKSNNPAQPNIKATKQMEKQYASLFDDDPLSLGGGAGVTPKKEPKKPTKSIFDD